MLSALYLWEAFVDIFKSHLWYEATPFLHRAASGSLNLEVKRLKKQVRGCIPEDSVVVVDWRCVLCNSPHLGHWTGHLWMWAFPTMHCEAQHQGDDVKEWGSANVYTVLSDLLFFISSADCSSVVGSARVCVLWDVNKRLLIASCRNRLGSVPLHLYKRTHSCVHIRLPLFAAPSISPLVASAAVVHFFTSALARVFVWPCRVWIWGSEERSAAFCAAFSAHICSALRPYS